MQKDRVELSILVGGKPVSEYLDKKGINTYIEGRCGSDYELRIRNNTGGDIEAVISVDGISVVTGEEAGPASTGYIVRAYSSVTIPGFMVDAEKAAKFTFGSPKESFAANSTGGDISNVGVIGVKVFSEKPKFPQYSYTTTGIWAPHGVSVLSSRGGAYPLGGVLMNNVTATCSASAMNAGSSDYYDQQSAKDVKQGLGTGFGAPTEHKTTQVHFDRGTELTTLVLYYDDIRGLEAREVRLPRKGARYVTEHKPNPFPATGCKPPAGWAEKHGL
jgi:hypothetical protein